ncbi:N-acetylmuramoyl-L-alanine amidase family protein [Caldanaerobius polysaccharolyticus]|uniref:N-acetylmuramoyl-L-alanine amidase family protein n=1 Tax=Caldanaerobius polysaccharolyticus TaxID=44256 RepID=UPI00047DEC02|nr:N-acetylmuramoyl-L-alanine amidase [Caldanaerobius polysaccharolyticus]
MHSTFYMTNLVTDPYSSCKEAVSQLKSRVVFEFTGLPAVEQKSSDRLIYLQFSPCRFNMPAGTYNIKDSTIDLIELKPAKGDTIDAIIHLTHHTRYSIKEVPGIPSRVYLYVDRSPLIPLFKNKTVHLDPLCNPRAISPTSLKEEIPTLDISKNLYQLLKLMQCNATITRDKPISFAERMKKISKLPPGILISIGTTIDDPKISGFKVFYYPPSEDSLNLAKTLHSAMKEKLPLNSLGIHAANIKELSYGNPGVLVEVGCIKNRVDEGHLRDVDYKQKVAQALYNGLKRYLEITPQG